ncbi:MlaD family protein [Mycolicibacterium holsaticum]|uniref:Mammalian cell entry protein n=1 Tax=Mycolicibacterium holsaticum TaxID=152142 RepID=A0A1E3S2N9_9MYCO|nr:MlaD family protein [Mycolicibacterium holsaticum]MDA4108497.1 mammalian cell entry protein [Mycolicibacterium holsaticum DSM 44478 = JCM 12374]ODQ96433.1 mammalian cell entry protein [Mycolicibacterium holsaticum]QZA12754.1 MlaD family protein [Mycolicibacterium holsaticum DSM 44478 = JCM 12374]UNC09772.1 MCE family protein [Mycolicibacterium holsaticum DSM 44478 = JCM 12374]
MRTVKNIASFVAFALLIAGTGTYIGSFGLHSWSSTDRINLSMDVPDVKGLVVGSSVLLRGAAVGKVTDVSSSANHATIDFYVNAEHQIPVDSDVRLDNLSALGEAYIGFIPRTDGAPMLRDGQRIAAESISVPPSISQLATTVVRILNQSDPDQLKRILDETDAALPDPGHVLPNLSRASSLFRNMVSGMDGKGQQVLDNFQTLLRNADWVGPTLAETTPSLHATGPAASKLWIGTMNVIAWNNPENMKLFQKFLDRIQGFLDTRAPDLKVLTQSLLPQFQGISGALMNFDSAQILSNTLAGIPEDGAITLRVTVPDP